MPRRSPSSALRPGCCRSCSASSAARRRPRRRPRRSRSHPRARLRRWRSMHRSTAPSMRRGIDSFVDLRDGRRTDIGYRSVFWIQGNIDPEFVDEWSERYEIVGERVVDGVAYRVEESTDPQDPGIGPIESLYRQDRSGLYLWQEDAGPIARNVIAAAADPRDDRRRARRVGARGAGPRRRGGPGLRARGGAHRGAARGARTRRAPGRRRRIGDHVPALPAAARPLVGRARGVQRVDGGGSRGPRHAGRAAWARGA